MNTLRGIVRTIDTISEWSGRIFGFFIVLLGGLSCYEVFTRRVLARPTIWTHEVLSYVFCAAVMLLIGYTLKERAHANVDLLYEHLSPRTQAFFDIITFIVFLGGFCAVLLVDGIIFAATSWSMQERTPSAFNFYVYPAKTLIPVGAFLLTIQAISDFIKRIVFLAKGERL